MLIFLPSSIKEAAEYRDRVSGATTSYSEDPAKAQVSAGLLAIKTEVLCDFPQLLPVNAWTSPQIMQRKFPSTSCPIRYCPNIQCYRVWPTKGSINKYETKGKCVIHKVTKSIIPLTHTALIHPGIVFKSWNFVRKCIQIVYHFLQRLMYAGICKHVFSR